MSNILLQADKLHRHYGDTQAVQGISLELRQGDILGLLGPNGAGKSSTMQMLSGVLAPSAGRILINNIDLLDQPKQAKQQIGYLPETPPLYAELRVDEYLTYCAQIRGIKKVDIENAKQKAMTRCGLQDVSRRLIGNLSKGYQQRVGIAQAIIHQPAVVILDEPTVGLDPIQIREIRQLIIELGKTHGVILSTHILPEVQAVCNRVEIINQGKLVFSDDMSAVNAKMQCNQLTVSFLHAPNEQQLLAIPGVQTIEPVTDKQHKLIVDNAEQVAEQLVTASVANNWGLVELTPVKQTLEQVFVELTSGDIDNQDEAA